MTIYERIKILCKLSLISIAKLERDLNLKKGTIQKWSKKCPPDDDLENVAKYFNTTIEVLKYDNKLSVYVDCYAIDLRNQCMEIDNDNNEDAEIHTTIKS